MPIGIDVSSHVTWLIVIIALVVLALTLSTRRGNLRPRDGTPAVDAWSIAQARFVDDPRAGCEQAQLLVDRALRERGRDSALPEPLETRYRGACAIIARGDASTDDLRQAFIECRATFDALRAGRATARDSRG